MTTFRFDPRRLARPTEQLEQDGYVMASELLRDYLGGGDIFAEVREGARRDPRLRAMLADAAALIAPAGTRGRPPAGRGVRRLRRPQ